MLVPSSTYAFKLKLKKNPTPMTDYTEWIPTQSFPEEIDGVRQFYPVSVGVIDEESGEQDTIAVVRGSVAVSGLTARQVMLAAMVYASDHFDRETQEGFEDIGYDDNRFTVLLKSTQGANANETTYARSLTVTARDGGFDFETSDIDCRYREKGIVPRTQRLEKLHPDNNKRHLSVLKEFIEVNSAYIYALSEYASTRSDIESPNFDKVCKGADVAVGMNEDEVTILLGKPMNKRRSGERVRWIYSNDYVIIFTEGKVSKIVD